MFMLCYVLRDQCGGLWLWLGEDRASPRDTGYLSPGVCGLVRSILDHRTGRSDLQWQRGSFPLERR